VSHMTTAATDELVAELDSHKTEWAEELAQCLGPWVEWLSLGELAAIKQHTTDAATVTEFAQALSPNQRGYVISAPKKHTRDEDDLNGLFPLDDVQTSAPARRYLSLLQTFLRTFKWEEVAIEE
jgi:hypothetical protein